MVLGTLPLLTYALFDWKTSLKVPSPCPIKGLSRKISIHAIYKSFLTVNDDELILLIILVDASTFLVRLNLISSWNNVIIVKTINGTIGIKIFDVFFS